MNSSSLARSDSSMLNVVSYSSKDALVAGGARFDFGLIDGAGPGRPEAEAGLKRKVWIFELPFVLAGSDCACAGLELEPVTLDGAAEEGCGGRLEAASMASIS